METQILTSVSIRLRGLLILTVVSDDSLITIVGTDKDRRSWMVRNRFDRVEESRAGC